MHLLIEELVCRLGTAHSCPKANIIHSNAGNLRERVCICEQNLLEKHIRAPWKLEHFMEKHTHRTRASQVSPDYHNTLSGTAPADL